MSHETFHAPDLDQLAVLLPAYDFEAFIAQGGMGAVYKAVQRSLDREVAIKILPRELGADPEFRSSFETEAKAMARLNHPNLIGVYDFGDVDGMPYIVMEYVNGKSLYHSAWNTVVEASQAVQITKGICEGLAHAHEAGIIHRDIKPANILLTPKAEPKIGDFGLAQPAGDNGPGLAMGTPGYVAPEFLKNPDNADKRSDIFAVGVILHELATGQRPDPEGLEAPVSTGDPALDAIWQKAVHPNPAFRYHDAATMARDLAAWTPATGAAPPPRQLVAAPTPAGGPRRPSPASTKMPRKSTTLPASSNSPLLRNLVIIAVLLVAIGVTYDLLKKTKAEREAENQYIQQQAELKREQEAAAAELARKEALAQAALEKSAKSGMSDPGPVTPPKEETPLESLARLRQALVAGVRAEMPIGATRHGSAHFLVIPEPMTWHQAAAFAEDHGGHLAVIAAEDDVTRLSQLVPEDSSIWIGAGRSADKSWTLIDGSKWGLEKSPGGVGSFAALDSLGLLRARKANETFPFVIQWRLDGANPGALAAMLERTRDSLDKPVPTFPPGTFSADARHFVPILRPLNRTQAAELAELAGGTLAIPATREESDAITDECENLDAPDGLWLGGMKVDAKWQWDGGEVWDFAEWSDAADHDAGGTGLVFIPGSGWKDAEPSDPASGVIIEWSRDAKGTAGLRTDEPPAPDARTAELDQRAAEVVAARLKDRDQLLEKNFADFSFDLDVWLGRLKGTENTRWTPEVAGLKALGAENRIPDPSTFDASLEIALSPDMAKIAEYRFGKQKEIDAGFTAEITKLRDAYTAKLAEFADEARGKGQIPLANQISGRIEAAADLDAWMASLQSGPTANKQESIPTEADPIIGRWNWMDGHVVVFLAGGTAVTDPAGKSITWKRNPEVDRSYTLVWDGQWQDQIVVAEDGDSLSGTNNLGREISATRTEE